MVTASLKQQSPASEDASIASAVLALQNAKSVQSPFPHWLFNNALPEGACKEIINLPIEAPVIDETYGKRDSHNDLRRFFSPKMQEQYGCMRDIAAIFQSEAVTRTIETLCNIKLKGSYLRIEYCQDRDGFWLEAHRDIKEKLMTMQIYLNTGPDAEKLGTDMYDSNKKWHSTAPSRLNQGMIFIPKEPESWHGFEKRPIQTLRRSLIINYVTDDWRAMHELAFPEQPIKI